jgi:hypothetical protein
MNRLTLLSEVITTAVTGATPDPAGSDFYADYVAIEAVFDWGSGGTTAKVYVQTSFDGGTTWCDVASFAFTTADLKKVSCLTDQIAPAAQAFTPTDGTLADNTVVNGVMGDMWRAKLTTTGTYAGNTNIAVYLNARN